MATNYDSYANLPLTLDAHDLQVVLRLSRAAVYRLMHDPQFPTIHVGSRMLVPRDKFIAWIELQTAGFDSIEEKQKPQKISYDLAR